MLCKLFSYTRRIISRITANMNHKHFYLLAQKNIFLRIPRPYFCSVNVSIYSTKRLEIFEVIADRYIANITGMPYFITAGKQNKKFFV